jgi:hypothetical protein
MVSDQRVFKIRAGGIVINILSLNKNKGRPEKGE